MVQVLGAKELIDKYYDFIKKKLWDRVPVRKTSFTVLPYISGRKYNGIVARK
jgi:hypothetical protein